MSGPRRLHPAGIAVLGLQALRGAAVPALFALVATVGGGDLDLQALLRAVGFAAVAATLAGLAGYLTWRTVSYAVSETAISARRGVLNVRETVVPLERVQAIDTVQGPLQRLFGVTAVHVQAAGGAREGEIVLEALSPEAVAELRERVGRGAGAGAAAAERPPPDAVRALSRGGLAAAALTAGQLGVILPALAGAWQAADDVLIGDDGAEGATGALGLLPDTAGEIVAAGLALLLVAWLLSIAGAVIAFAGFTVTREGDRLLIRRGLLARREASVPLGRVQGVTMVEGLLRQPFGLASLRVETAGYAAEAAAAQTLFPLLRRSEVEPFLAAMVPALAGAPGGLAPPPPRARRRYVLPPVLAALVPAVAVALRVPGAGWWPLLAVLPAAAAGVAAHRAAGWRLEDRRLLVRSRRLARRTAVLARRRLQEHVVAQTPLQHRASLATLSVAVGTGTRTGVAHLEAATARELFTALRAPA